MAQQRRPAIDYSKFSHTSKTHQAAACNTCHKAPTKDWARVSKFPDIKDYPSHDACVSCHKPQFFRGAKPPICAVCHSKTSPRDDARFVFRNPASKLQFAIEFPHDKHQDVIAMLRFAHATQQKYYNCTGCHGQGTASFFKPVPSDHASCFNCHWKSQKPVADNCGGCHKPAAPDAPVNTHTPKRISAKFNHEGGGKGENKQHAKECTTCHINITKPAPPGRKPKPKPDVPITACTECHNTGTRRELTKEMSSLKKDRTFTCSRCHEADFGSLDPPPSHFAITKFPVFTRK